MTPYYDRDGITIYHADCRDVLPLLPPGSVDLVLTDPPYNATEINGRDGTTVGRLQRKDGTYRDVRRNFGEWDRAFDADELLTEARRVLKERGGFLAFCGDRTVGDYMDGPLYHLRVIVWSKTNAAPHFPGNYQSSVEFCVWQGKNGPATFTGNGVTPCVFTGPIVPASIRRHPNEKPQWLIRELVRLHSKHGDVIVDPYLGSGTTLQVAKEFGRRAIGIEREEEHCATAVARLQQSVLPLEVA